MEGRGPKGLNGGGARDAVPDDEFDHGVVPSLRRHAALRQERLAVILPSLFGFRGLSVHRQLECGRFGVDRGRITCLVSKSRLDREHILGGKMGVSFEG